MQCFVLILDVHFALKECTFVGRRYRKKAMKEADLLKSLTHQHIIEYKEAFTHEYIFYFIMELALRGDLHEEIKEKQRNHDTWDRAAIQDMFSQILSGLEYLHSNRVMHRDLKPSNILVQVSVPNASDDNPVDILKIADFGLARVMDASKGTAAYARSRVGTELYRSPEITNTIMSFILNQD